MSGLPHLSSLALNDHWDLTESHVLQLKPLTQVSAGLWPSRVFIELLISLALSQVHVGMTTSHGTFSSVRRNLILHGTGFNGLG